MLERQSNIIQPFEQAITLEVVDLEGRGKTVSVADCLALEIDYRAIVVDLFSSTHQLRYFSIIEYDGQETVLQAIIREDVRE